MIFGRKRRQRLKEMRALGLRIEELSRKAQSLTRIVDHKPPNSVAWQNAVREFARLTKESLDLARMLGDPNILEIAETVGACVRGECPVEAVAAGL